jgi:hypothetical protein
MVVEEQNNSDGDEGTKKYIFMADNSSLYFSWQ